MVKKIDSVSKWKKSVKSSSSKSKLKKANLKKFIKPIPPRVLLPVPKPPVIPPEPRLPIPKPPVIPPEPRLPIPKPIIPRPRLPIPKPPVIPPTPRLPIPKPIILDRCKIEARIEALGKGLMKQGSFKVTLDPKAEKILQNILKNENLSAARQKTLIKNAVCNPDKVISSKQKNKNTVEQNIAYDYKAKTLVIKAAISDGAVVIKDIKAKLKSAKKGK